MRNFGHRREGGSEALQHALGWVARERALGALYGWGGLSEGPEELFAGCCYLEQERTG